MVLRRCLTFASLLLVCGTAAAQSAVRLGAPFGNHMVLPQSVPVEIWGSGCPGGDTVQVYVAGQTVSTKSDWDGKWKVTLAPMKPGGPYQMLVHIGGGGGPMNPSPAANDKGGAELNDILVGDVLLSGSQGPGEPVKPIATAPKQAASSAHPYAFIRVYKTTPGRPGGEWTFVSQDTVPSDTAALFSAGRAAYEKRGVPVGVMDSSNGPVCSPASNCYGH